MRAHPLPVSYGSRPMSCFVSDNPGPRFCDAVNPCTYALEFTQNIQIAESQHTDPLRFQIRCSDTVVLRLCRFTMLETIQLHSQSCAMAIKIHDVISNGILPAKLQRILSEKCIPEEPFFLRLIFPQALGIPFQCRISFQYVTLQQVSTFPLTKHCRPHSSSVRKIGSEEPIFLTASPRGKRFGCELQHLIFIF